MKNFSYGSMGTEWAITIWDNISDEKLKSMEDSIIKMSEDFNQKYSRFIEYSLVSQIARSKGEYKVPEDFLTMLKIYFSLYEPSDKKLNPLVGFTISDLGYDADYSLTPKDQIRKTPDLEKTVRIISDNKIETLEPVLFDFGALGKGYMVDKISAFLKNEKIETFMVNGSGDIYHSGKETIKVGLEDPNDFKKVVGIYYMNSGAMCASGTNRRKWRNLHHVINPETSLPTEGIISTWVFAEQTVMADALASCLFFVPPERLIQDFKFEYCIMNENRQIKHSPRFKAEFF